MNQIVATCGKYFKQTMALTLKITIALLLLVMMIGEWSHFQVTESHVEEAWIKYSNADEFEKLTKGQMAFTALAYEQKLENDRGFVVKATSIGGNSNHVILHLPFQNNSFADPRLHIKSFFGSKVWIFNDANKLLYYDDKTIVATNVMNELSEAYVPYDSSGINILIEGRSKDHYIGIEGDAKIVAYEDSLRSIFLEGYSRRVVAFFLLIAAAVLYGIKHLLNLEHSKNLFESLALFFGIFGVWIMLDFSRYSLWIVETFHGMPVVVLKIMFFFALSFLNYSFVNLCYFMMLQSRYSKFLKGLRLYALIVGVTEFVFIVALLFTWSPFLFHTSLFVENISMGSVSIGSLLLLGISILEALKGNRTAMIFAVGFAICEVTFIISQLTPLLISHWGVLVLAMTFAVIISHEFNLAKRDNIEYTTQLVQKNKEMSRLYSDLEGAQHEILYLLGSAVDLRSKETSNHVKRVADYTRLFAVTLGYARAEADLIALASTLHDIGKVGIADSVLNKPGKLNIIEYENMKEHALMGYEMLKESELELIRTAAIIAMNHHERFDGTGYPHGYAGDQIHPYGRIVAASDVLDALLSPRVYKDAWTFEEVTAYFEEERGKQFEPAIVDVLISNLSLFRKISETSSW